MRETAFRNAIAERRGPLPHPRFGVYRNNVAAGLATALAVRHPMVQRLIGEAAFLRLAADFTEAGHLPESPVLIDYGPDFAAFAGGHEAAREHPFIGELAELESRWWQAYHAPEAEALSPQDFAAAGDPEGLRFRFHPSASLLAARWPAGTIWQILAAGGRPQGVRQHPEHILVARPDAEVRVAIVPPDRALFLARLMTGEDVAAAVAATHAAHPEFDLQSSFEALIAARLVTHFDRTA